MSRVAVIILSVNFLTAWVMRILSGKSVKTHAEGGASKRAKLVFCIAGLFNQPETAFRHVTFPGYKKVYVRFSQFGWNPRWMGRALKKLKGNDDIAAGISIGAQVVWNMNASKAILINPCGTPKVLQEKYYWLIKTLSPIVQVIAYVLGWVSFIPFIPAQDGCYSIALLADQLFWTGYVEDGVKNPNIKTGIIISTNDEFLDNDNISKYYNEKAPRALVARIDTMHARIGDEKDAPKYQEEINHFIKNIS